jgi:hypothetical protein
MALVQYASSGNSSLQSYIALLGLSVQETIVLGMKFLVNLEVEKLGGGHIHGGILPMR